MDRIRTIRNKVDLRCALIGIQVTIFIISAIYGIHGFIYDPLPKNDTSNATLIGGYSRLNYISSNIFSGFISGQISILFAIIGIFSPELHEDSSMIIHSSWILWVVHLILMWQYSKFDRWYLDNWEIQKLTIAGDVMVNFVYIVLFTIMIILSTKLLRKNNSVWPRSNLMKFFTLESPLVLARMAISLTLYTIVATGIHVGSGIGMTSFTEVFFDGFIFFAAAFNGITSLEHCISLFWGVPHRKSIGIQALLSSVSMFGVVIVTAIENVTYFLKMLNPLFSTTAVLALVHGILNLTIPAFITKVPKIFNREQSNRTEVQNVTENSLSVEDGSVSYSRMFTNMLRSNDNDDQPLSQTEPNKLNLKELIKQSSSFIRNFFYIVVCTIIFTLIGYSLTMKLEQRVRWGPMIILCASATVVLRIVPDFFVEVITRKPLKEPPLAQVFTSVVIESILLIIGALGTWITPSFKWLSSYTHSAAGISLIVVILHILHLRNYVIKSS